MKTEKNNDKIKNDNSPQNKVQKTLKKENKNINQYIRFIKTNLYLNEYNYFFKNAIKMNKIREEKFKEYKLKTEIARKNNKLPKMLYSNKYLNNEVKNCYNKRNNNKISIRKTNTSDSLNLNTECISSENRPYVYKKIEKAILAQNIEENNKSHIKKTIKVFDDLIKCIDNVKLQNKRPKLNIMLDVNNDKYKSDLLEDKEEEDNIGEEDDLNIENYNFDEYKKQYKDEKLFKHKSNSHIHLKTYNTQRGLKNNFSDNFKKTNDNIYLTASNNIKNGVVKNDSKNNIINGKTIFKTKDISTSFDKNEIKNNKKKKLLINNMTLISDDSLVKKIKNIGRDFKKGLFFNEYGKFKFTELGLNYPNSCDKYKKIPDYKGNDLEEKKIFKYKSLITNPKYNYTNIGSFNDKFNHDLSDISNYYGKEFSKGRFLRNPLVSKYIKFIPNYEKYKDLKSIENRYTSKNKYKFRLKPLINTKKNNFDKLANNVYKKEHKNDFFQ